MVKLISVFAASMTALVMSLPTSAEDFLGGPAPVYVSITTGNNANPGTQAQPVASINVGLNIADPTDRPVYVAAGMYSETVNLRSGVAILGGFDAGTWTRDVSLNITHIIGFDRPVRGSKR